MLTYLASCGNTTCDKFDAIDAKWFKIDEVGQKTNSANWFQEDISAYSQACSLVYHILMGPVT